MLDQGYGIMPNKILFDENLSDSAKLLYVYISSLCAEKGHCWAKNEHLAERFKLSTSQISRLIASLKPYLEIQDGSNERRKIYLREPTHVPTQKAQGSLRKNAQAHIKINSTRLINSKDSQETALRTAARKVYETYLMYFVIGEEKYKNLPQEEKAAAGAQAQVRYRFTPKRESKIIARLRELKGDSTTLLKAVIGFGKSEFHLGDNDRNWKADLIEYICRDYETIEKGVGLYEKQKNSSDPWDKL